MTVSIDHPTRSTAPTSVATLEDRFEILKEIGDGSFGSVAVARVRTAGASVARRGTMVRIQRPRLLPSLLLIPSAGSYQVDEKDIRVSSSVLRVARSHFPTFNTNSPSPGPSTGHLPRPLVSQATHLHGVHGW